MKSVHLTILLAIVTAVFVSSEFLSFGISDKKIVRPGATIAVHNSAVDISGGAIHISMEQTVWHFVDSADADRLQQVYVPQRAGISLLLDSPISWGYEQGQPIFSIPGVHFLSAIGPAYFDPVRGAGTVTTTGSKMSVSGWVVILPIMLLLLWRLLSEYRKKNNEDCEREHG